VVQKGILQILLVGRHLASLVLAANSGRVVIGSEYVQP
jgi:hypothetical protein